MATADDPRAGWLGLLRDGVQQCLTRCHGLPVTWQATIERLIAGGRAVDLIQAASCVEGELRKNHPGQYQRWLSESVGMLTVKDSRVIDALLDWHTRVATTNYDNLLAAASNWPAVTWAHDGQVLEVLRGRQHGILHLHGHYTMPSTVVFGASSYDRVCQDQAAQTVLQSVFVRDVVVFIGCGAGADDPNIGGLLHWARGVLASVTHTHFDIVRDCDQDGAKQRNQGLPIEVVPYGPNYSDLAPFLVALTRDVLARRPAPLVPLAPRQLGYDAQRQALAADAGVLSSERVRRMFELGRELWDNGGRRTAAMDLSAAVLRHGPQLPGDEHVWYALEAARYALEDNLEFSAGQLLERAHPHVAACSAELQTTFAETHIRWLAAQGDTSGLLATIAEALATATQAERPRLEAERDEVLLLDGQLARL